MYHRDNRQLQTKERIAESPVPAVGNASEIKRVQPAPRRHFWPVQSQQITYLPSTKKSTSLSAEGRLRDRAIANGGGGDDGNSASSSSDSGDADPPDATATPVIYICVRVYKI